MKCFNVGILGTGSIAQSMAFTLNALKDKGEVVPYAIASRSLKKAENFAREWHFEKHIAAMRLLSLTLLWILSILLLHTLYIMSMLCFVLITVKIL